MDLRQQPEIIQKAIQYATQGCELAKSWLLSPAAWSQFAILIAAYLLAVFLTRKLRPFAARLLTPQAEQQNIFAKARRFVLIFTPLFLPLLAYGLTGLGESVTRSILGSGEVIAFGKRVFLFLVACILVDRITKDRLLKLLGKFVLVLMAAFHAVGLLELVANLDMMVFPLGNLSFSLLFLVRFAVLGGIIFWFGRWSNDQSSSFIAKQEEMRPATRELASKTAEIVIFCAAFLVLMNIMGISLTSLAVLGGAIGVGLGFGLQKTASNFISGVILLLEGRATIGDYVELDGGEAGTIVKITARAAILETYDGRWIVVPNEGFITTRVVYHSDSGSANRYEAPFSASYDTDINLVPDIVEKAVSKNPEVLSEPFRRDCELRSFGDSGVNFAVEFWVNGIDHRLHNFTSDVLFIVWNALKENGIEIPYLQRIVELKGEIRTRAT